MSIHEECGVFGVMAEQPEDVAGLVMNIPEWEFLNGNTLKRNDS